MTKPQHYVSSPGAKGCAPPQGDTLSAGYIFARYNLLVSGYDQCNGSKLGRSGLTTQHAMTMPVLIFCAAGANVDIYFAFHMPEGKLALESVTMPFLLVPYVVLVGGELPG